MAPRRLGTHDLHPFAGTDVWRLVLARARTHQGRPFMVWQPFDGPAATTTFDELARRAAAVATGLAGRGVRPGDRVLVHLENSPEFVIAWFACAALGAVAVTTNTRSAGDELAYYAQDSAAVAAITQPRFVELVERAAPGLRTLVSTEHDSGVPADTDAPSFAALHGDPDDLPNRPPDPLAPCSVQYTSGTTSRPKGVLWTHANALWGARSNAANETLRPDDCHLVYLPLFHTNALAYSMLASLWVGARFVLTPKWSTSRFWDISLRHGCTWLSLMGLSGRAVAEYDPVPAGHSYRLFGARVCELPVDSRYGVRTIGWWGMTETISHPIVGDPYVPNTPNTMGRPNPLYRVRVVRPDGTPTEVDEPGGLLVLGVRGLSMFAEYLNRPDATAESFDDEGWFHTGDLVVAHADGHLSFDNRVKDMLRVGGENVSAAEVERVILEVPGVLEVGVVGRADHKLDEVPVAFVSLRADTPEAVEATLEKVAAACAERLADFKCPRSVYRVTQFPRSTLSKINKVELRAVAAPESDRAGAQRRWVADAVGDPSGNAG